MPEPMIGQLQSTPFHLVPAEATVGLTLVNSSPAQVLVVMAAPDRLLGLLTRSQVQDYSPTATLGDLVDEMEMLTLVVAETPLSEVLRAMRHYPLCRWQVVMDGASIARVIDPETLFDLLRRTERGQNTGLSETTLFGDPDPPAATWYQCTDAAQHCVPSTQVRQRTPRGRPLCPCDNSLMNQTNLCSQSTCQEA